MKRDSAERGTVKTSTILIAAGKRTAVYRKLEEVPPILRRTLLKSTAGSNAGTVVIADRRGARELLRANLRALINRQKETRASGIRAYMSEDFRLALRFLLAYRRWVALLLVFAALICWVAATVRF